MRQRSRGALAVPGIRRLVAAAVAVALTALLLARWQPWRDTGPTTPRPVALVPTPTPQVPTPTRAPERIALPSITTTSPAAIATPSRPATPTGRRAGGTILSSGVFGGRAGIVATAADGSSQRLLVAGDYETIAWSPDGARFAAAGPLEGGGAAQVAIFDAAGRPLARYPIEGRVDAPLLWSPDSREIAWSVAPPGTNAAGQPPPTQAWRATFEGAARRVPVPDSRQASPFAWSADGDLFVVSVDPASARAAIWRAGRGEGLPVPILDDTILPLAFSDDGATLYALGPTIQPAPTTLIAIDLRSGARRTLETATDVGAAAFGSPAAPGTDTFPVAVVAPGGAWVAVIVERPTQPGEAVQRPQRELVFVSRLGGVLGIARAASGTLAWPLVWSPDGTLLAFNANGEPLAESALAVVDMRGAQHAAVPAARVLQQGGSAFTWSADGRWLAFAGEQGIAVLSLDDGTSYTLAVPVGALAWRP
ncbi:MAG: hypothetical protein U0232_22625 [Thermomicrobiales bacterium]